MKVLTNHKAWVVTTLGLFLLLLFLPNFYFKDRFNVGTHVGGVSIAGLNVQEAEKEIITSFSKRQVIINEGTDVLDTLAYADFFQVEGMSELLTDVMDNQGFWLKGSNVGLSKEQVSLREDQIDTWVIDINNGRDVPEDAMLGREENGVFTIIPEVMGDTIDEELFADTLREGIDKESITIDISDLYQIPTIYQDNPTLVETMVLGNKLRTQTFVLELPDDIHVEVPADFVNAWLAYSYADEAFAIDTEAVAEWLITVNDEHMAYLKPIPFESTHQGHIHVPAGSLGWAINREETANLITQGLLDNELHNRRLVEAVIDGLDYDLSPETGSYIEVDLTHQTMLVYLDGELQLETPIVSGMSQGQPPTPTIPGAYQIWNKESPSVLVGVNQQMGNDYEQPVDYWLPFDDVGQGIHDANWQGTFGGTAYHLSGSQGCINTPPADMPLVYELAYVGMPVLVFGS